jgi:NTE family protein
MNDNHREMLVSCLTQIFGRVEDNFVDQIAPMLRWIELPGGETLFEEGDAEDGIYLVISGRLRALVREDGGTKIVGEIVQGQTVGEMAVLTHEPRAATIKAIRDSVLAHVSREQFEILTKRHPELTVHVARVIIERLRRTSRRGRPTRPKTVCLLAVTDGIDAVAFGEKLLPYLERWGVVSLETSARIDERFGAGTAQATPAEADAHHKLTMWLDDLEFWNEYVVFASDAADSEWTRRSIRHADHILLLARADAPVAQHPLEEKYLTGAGAVTAAQQTLVLLHDESVSHPSGTPAWLDRRPVTGHLHIRPSLARDLSRLARVLSGNAVGLVFAGGGARGFAHLGAYRALEEAGIAIDCVGGTSIGAAMAAYVSFDLPAKTMIDRARQAFRRNPTGDMNLLPMISLIRGRTMKRTIDRAIVDAVGFAADASDPWRNYFCVATNFSRAREIVLTRGDMATCIRASVSIPVALPPVIHKGELLLDGGTFNNFPTDVMATIGGAGKIIGVDLSRQKTRTFDHLTEVPSPFSLFLDRWRHFKKRKYRLPSLSAILMETTILYSTSRQALARQSVDVYVNPDLGRIGLLEWKAFDRIVDIGYRQMVEVLKSIPEETLALYRDEVAPESGVRLQA